MADQPIAPPQWPRYQSHKKVWALKIAKVDTHGSGGGEVTRAVLYPIDGTYEPIEVTGAWLLKHEPKEGGYVVLYDDGYMSYSPAEAFESGYMLISLP